MIITRNWLNEFIDITDISTDEICKALNSIGLEVDSVETISMPAGVKIGYVESKEKHPDADKLNVCQVNLGDHTTQIVCGAKNVDAGQFVPVATIGCVLGEDFKIKKAKLRGVESNGMICSSTEIGLPKMNDGILVLDDSIGELKLGTELSELSIFNDDIIEIELTANRGDCLSIHGVARDLSAYFDLKMIQQDLNFNTSDKTIGQILNVKTSNEATIDTIVSSADFTNFSLPVIYKIKTAIAGCYNDDNEILTASAYVTHCTGVLFDLMCERLEKDDMGLNKLTIKKDEQGFCSIYSNEKITTLGIDSNDIKVCETSEQVEHVTMVAFYTNPDVLAQKVFDTKIKTSDIYYKSSRGSEYDIDNGMQYLQSVLSKAGVLIHQSTKQNINTKDENYLDLKIQDIYNIIGEEIDLQKMIQILESLKFGVKKSGDFLTVTIPFFRHDIKNIADVTEEIVRIVGIDNIQAKPLAMTEANTTNKTSIDIAKRNDIRRKAISNGFFESITYVFSSKENLEKYGFATVNEKKDITNPITKELNTFRSTILLNLLDAVSNNYKYGYSKVALFENGIVFDANREESKKLAFVHSGVKENENISNNGKPQNMDLFGFASKVANVIGDFELEPITNISNKFIHPYQSGNIVLDGQTIGYVSKLHPSVANDFDIDDTFIAEIDFEKIPNALVQASDISKFQASKRDLSIIAPKEMPYKEIKKVIHSLNIEQVQQFNLVDIYSDEKLGNNESLTIRFVIQDQNKTMEEQEINAIMDKILEALDSNLSVGIR
jgi:phenylalanyl-tRNA synthetase beta chain